MSTPPSTADVRRGRPRDPTVRSRVLAAAANQLAATGFTAMTMEGILAESGVARRTLYRWWPNKAAVVAEAILDGAITVPREQIRQSADVWADLNEWLTEVAELIHGPYGEVLRASTSIGAADPELSESLTQSFAQPVRDNLIQRLESARFSGQLAATADVDAVVDILMATIVYVGITRGDATRVSAALGIIRSGIER